ncbi:MAG: hypothetical protein DSM106950_18140 [Stigonema ocellatum SAG 48.90 = DSM 106950]|nr:hypothetical protein [Stigonema ocellatum SAG 48.90 = DSM 106950]
MINREFADGMDYGVGYDSLSGQVRGDWVETTEPKPPIGGAGQEIFFQLHQVNSTQELAQYLDISASANITSTGDKDLGNTFQSEEEYKNCPVLKER